MKVTSSFTLAHKLIVFVDTEAVDSPELKSLIEGELGKNKQGFSEVVVIGRNTQAVVFQS